MHASQILNYIPELPPQRYTRAELVAVRRDTLRYARSFPPGVERNQHRQIAASLRSLFRNRAWLEGHVQD